MCAPGGSVSINLESGTVSGGTGSHAIGDVIVRVNNVSTIENVVGSEGFGDTLTGDSRANKLSGTGWQRHYRWALGERRHLRRGRQRYAARLGWRGQHHG